MKYAILALFLITWKPEYAQNPPEVQDWYKSRILTPETKARLGVPWNSCCDHSDVVRTQFRANKSDGKDEWWYVDPTDHQWKLMPDDIIQEGDPSPDNQPTLFMVGSIPTCFFSPNAT